MENRRRFSRFEFPLQVKYLPQSRNEQSSYTISSNISMGGLCMPAISSVIKDGDVVKLDINDHGETHIPATGKVRWLKMLNRKALLDEEAGIEFIDVVSADIDRLIKSHTSL